MIGVELCDGAIFAWAVRTLLQMFVVSVVNAARVVMVGCPVSAVGPTKIGVADEYTTGARDADGGTPGVWDTCVMSKMLRPRALHAKTAAAKTFDRRVAREDDPSKR